MCGITHCLIAIVVSDFLKLVATVTTTDIRSRDQLRALVIDHRNLFWGKANGTYEYLITLIKSPNFSYLWDNTLFIGSYINLKLFRT